MAIKSCIHCGGQFEPVDGRTRTCAEACRIARWREGHATRERKRRAFKSDKPATALRDPFPCSNCKNPFIRRHSAQVFCSSRCRGVVFSIRADERYRAKFPLVVKACVACGGEFQSARGYQEFCSPKCQESYSKGILRRLRNPEGLSKISAGVFCELLVACDLYGKGWEIFKPLSHSAPFDLIATRNDELIRIEVKAGRRRTTGAQPASPPRENQKFDCLAVVCTLTDIDYRPSIDAACHKISFKA